MAKIEEIRLGAAVRMLDGWGGIAIVVGIRARNQSTGTFLLMDCSVEGEAPDEPDKVEIRFHDPAWHPDGMSVSSFTCDADKLILL